MMRQMAGHAAKASFVAAVSTLLFCRAVLGFSPIAEWRAQDASETVWRDASGQHHDAAVHNVILSQEKPGTDGQRSVFFRGDGSYAEIPDNPSLNPAELSILVWCRLEPGILGPQVPLIVKSLAQHTDPWYQYGLFLADVPDHEQSLSFYASVQGRSHFIECRELDLIKGWVHLAAVCGNGAMKLYFNGAPVASAPLPAAPLDAHGTPLAIAAYGSLPKISPNLFRGYIGAVVLYDVPLADADICAIYENERGTYPIVEPMSEDTSEYAQHLNAVLSQGRDIWGEELIARGGATYDGIKDFLRPLFYSTGMTNTSLGAHTLVFGENGGEPPYIIPLADGSRVAANMCHAAHALSCFVGEEGREPYGLDLSRLGEPCLDGGYYPILRTQYRDSGGRPYEQECFPGRVEGVNHIVAFIRVRSPAAPQACTVRFSSNSKETHFVRYGSGGTYTPGEWVFKAEAGANLTACVVWSPQNALPDTLKPCETLHEKAMQATRDYWDQILEAGHLFNVPEPLAMNAQRNLLIQNLIMRWRYSLGSVVYHDAWFQPEGNEAASVLAEYGYLDAARGMIEYLLPLTKGENHYNNWVRGEKLSHGARYFFLARDMDFLRRNTDSYKTICDELLRQLREDPNGLLFKERHCGDIGTPGYWAFHQSVCWRGLRDIAEAWKMVGRADLHAAYRPVADRFRRNLLAALEKGMKRLPDGTLFVPSLMLGEVRIFDPITATRKGSYWNICMPYAFSSGLWDMAGSEMAQALDYVHNHGGTLLGLLRFNYYPVPVGASRVDGLPGYYTTGFNNVYLPGYLQLLAGQDRADRLVLSFYGKLAHGQTRGTFVSGEGETVGTRRGEFYRSCYGTPSSANNSGFLLALRLMLVRESFSDDTGLPANLYLAHATPREWLEDGKRIEVKDSPTAFGPVSFSITSRLTANMIEAVVRLPERNPPAATYLRLRTPDKRQITSAMINGGPWPHILPDGETINLTECPPEVRLAIRYK